MKKFFKITFLLTVVFIMGFTYGYFVHRNQIFPSRLIRKSFMWDLYRREMKWSIGVYEGDSPFDLTDPEDIDNPVLRARDVTDVDAAFVADPFIVNTNGKYYMFFEVMNLDTFHGDIGYAVSDDGKKWNYQKIILDESFHLSFPGVYLVDGQYYMIPESSEDMSVRLYKAISFPEKWEYIGNLLKGEAFNDPILFQHNSKFWIFVSFPGFNTLNLYYSETLSSGWKGHPGNPLVENNRHMANPAGKIVEYDGSLYRITQDCLPYYGTQVFGVKIKEITDKTYLENSDSLIHILSPSGSGWNRAGMHQADIFNEMGYYRAAVDGIRRR